MLTHKLAADAAPTPGLVRSVLTFAKLGEFVSHLRESAARYGTAIVPPEADPEHIPEDGYDLDVSGIALAAAARIFEFDSDVIALIEEAQFRGCAVHIGRARGGAPVMMAATPSPSRSDARAIQAVLSGPICPTCATSYDPSRYDRCDDRACCSNCGTLYRVPDRLRPLEDQLEHRPVGQVQSSQLQAR